jgi:hypothetical protein
MMIARDEIFGPVLSVLTYRTEDEAVEIANGTVYGLGGYIFASTPQRVRGVAERLRAGRVFINGANSNTAVPMGGYKQSGNGREMGVFGFEEYLEVKAIIGLGTATAPGANMDLESGQAGAGDGVSDGMGRNVAHTLAAEGANLCCSRARISCIRRATDRGPVWRQGYRGGGDMTRRRRPAFDTRRSVAGHPRAGERPAARPTARDTPENEQSRWTSLPRAALEHHRSVTDGAADIDADGGASSP